MGITPITNLIPLQVVRALKSDLEPLPMERVENSSRTGDETYSSSNGQSNRGSEDDASEDDAAEDDLMEDALDEPSYQSSPETTAHPAAPSQPRPISFFA